MHALQYLLNREKQQKKKNNNKKTNKHQQNKKSRKAIWVYSVISYLPLNCQNKILTKVYTQTH